VALTSVHPNNQKDKVIIMRNFIRPAILALALLGTVSAASAATKPYSYEGEHAGHSLSQQLAFWEQFAR
jgi:hypothetical protein